MEELVTSLLERVGRDQKVIGWQACRHGDGCSTLLLAVARRLAERGLKVALVDADFQHPSLARRLGLTPTSGWEGVLAGHVSLPEVVVESLREGIGLAPWCVPGAEDPACDATPTDPASALDTLRRGYDVVLVDLGRGQSGGGCADLLPSLRSQLDLTVVVHNVGEVPLTELRQVCRTLSRTGTAALAVVENFV
jgi:Mrp family chromosome partitioning ATPase